jgi:hypothetical protein
MTIQEVLQFAQGIKFPIEYPEFLQVNYNDMATHEIYDPVYSIKAEDREGVGCLFIEQVGDTIWTDGLDFVESLSVGVYEDYINEQQARYEEQE